jgi:hypothetical protein
MVLFFFQTSFKIGSLVIFFETGSGSLRSSIFATRRAGPPNPPQATPHAPTARRSRLNKTTPKHPSRAPAPTPWRRAAAGSPYRCRGSARWWRSSSPWWLRPGRRAPTRSYASTSSLSSPPPLTRPPRSARPLATSFPSAQISPLGAVRAPVRLLMSL